MIRETSSEILSANLKSEWNRETTSLSFRCTFCNLKSEWINVKRNHEQRHVHTHGACSKKQMRLPKSKKNPDFTWLKVASPFRQALTALRLSLETPPSPDPPSEHYPPVERWVAQLEQVLLQDTDVQNARMRPMGAHRQDGCGWPGAYPNKVYVVPAAQRAAIGRQYFASDPGGCSEKRDNF